MGLTLADYADSLDERDLIWPQVPAAEPVRARPSTAPLPGIRIVLWDVYGTLLRIPDEGFTLFPEPEIRLQVALEKTIHEFNMWNSMYRKPGPPWQSMIHQYRDYAERLAMLGTKRRGDFTAVNAVHVWRAIIDRLFDKEYHYDEDVYGDVDALSEKVAYFFQSCLQATEARADALRIMTHLSEIGLRQGLLGDGQIFTPIQLLRSLRKQGEVPPLRQWLPPEQQFLSYQMGIRAPSRSLFEFPVARLRQIGIAPDEILYVSSHLKTNLAPARSAGMRTALLAAEKNGLEAPADFIKDSHTRPDRLLTGIDQITSIVGER
ncbi:MAG: HAD family hydrolase [Planctomycetaceae bacterium]